MSAWTFSHLPHLHLLTHVTWPCTAASSYLSMTHHQGSQYSLECLPLIRSTMVPPLGDAVTVRAPKGSTAYYARFHGEVSKPGRQLAFHFSLVTIRSRATTAHWY